MSRKKKPKPHQLKTNYPKSAPVSDSKPKGISLTLDGRNPPSAWPSVSLCMIVKNEEKNLAACLKSVGNFVSEIIVVDTGSIDRSVEIAQSLGAKVKHFTWINDFAAARNESIREASGDWIFWLDADDRISPDNLDRLKQALVSGQADVYSCQIVSQGAEARSATDHLRLFRNHRGLRFDYALHETIIHSAERQGVTVAWTNITIDHMGYQIGSADLQSKARRNLTIIQQQLAQESDNLHWHYHLGVCQTVLEDYAAAAEAYERVITAPPSTLNWDFDVYQAYVSLLNVYVQLNRLEAAQQLLQRALQVFPRRRHLAILAGIFYLMQDEPEAAVKILEQAKTFPVESDRVGHAWSPGKLEAELGRAYLWLGNLPQSKSSYQDMLMATGATNQAVPDKILYQAQSLFEAKAYTQVTDLLAPYAQSDPVVLRLLAQTEQRLQQWGSAARNLGQAIALGQPHPGEWVNLAECLLKSSKLSSAERLCHLALSKDRENADTLNLLGLIAIQQNKAEAALSYLIQALLINPQHISANNNLEQLARGLQLTPSETIRQYGLKMLHQQKYTSANEALALFISLNPDNSEAYKLLAVVLQRLGREEDALLAWQMAQRLE